ncbi:MAG: hypothetical protein IH623_27825 [Verrucomicrobia bacterium]|nr:hypothetical protein [Verrucomicrobiota bacterium]
MNTLISQPDLDFNIEQPDWVALRLLISKIDEEMAQQRKHLLMKVSNWFLAISLFREFEDKRFFLAEPADRDKEHHRAFLTHLMAQGEMLAMELRKHDDIDPKHIGLELTDIEATVQYLRDCHAGWFTDISDANKERILAEVFGEQTRGS